MAQGHRGRNALSAHASKTRRLYDKKRGKEKEKGNRGCAIAEFNAEPRLRSQMEAENLMAEIQGG